MKLSDKLAALEEEANAPKPLGRREVAMIKQQQIEAADRIQNIWDRFMVPVSDEILATDPATGEIDPSRYDHEVATQFGDGLKKTLLEFAMKFDSTTASNGQVSEEEREPLVRVAGSSRRDRHEVAPPSRKREASEPALFTALPGDTNSIRRRKSPESFTSHVPHFEWVCAAAGMVGGFFVASATRDLLHYSGQAGKVVPVIWILLITAFFAWVCYGIGNYLNRKDEDE
jgi:hypothetical protein